MPDITVAGLSKAFGQERALNDISFTVHDKEFLTLLGPSGCGKTTTLMSIAGFQRPDEGTITCGDRVFFDQASKVDLTAQDRNLGIVFQSYAIWPHLTVFGNVAFPLRIRKVTKDSLRRRVLETLELVEMAGYAGRYPHELSGGQQQRVALARALVYAPAVLLLDEPFSNLDAKLRERARDWLKELQHTLGLTTVFVTHDQDEALSMSDRIVVMNAGRILREGTPEEVYRQPRVRFVAEFLGRYNFLTGAVGTGPDGDAVLTTAEFSEGITVHGRHDGPSATIAVRPEDIEISSGIQLDAPGTGTEASVLHASYLGDHYHYRVAVGAMQLSVHSQRPLAPGPVRLRIPPGVATFVD
ncbi:MAG TPA: ABC transporter ATP-binding protein [Streptosporangiaceae bacterium]